MKIWKYEIDCDSRYDGEYVIPLTVPPGSKPLSVHVQNGKVCVWVEVDPEQSLRVQLLLYSVGTGYGIVPEGKTFLGTVIQGQFVWHLYY